jgi:hypothetical protein
MTTGTVTLERPQNLDTALLEALIAAPKKPAYHVHPVFARAGLACDPEQEMLSVVQVVGSKVVPVDCIPLKALGEQDVSRACDKVSAAFSKARSELQVTWRKASKQQMAGWEVTTEGVDKDGQPETHHLAFILKHFGENRLNDVLRQRTREHAHRDMNLDLGPNYYSFMIQQMKPW